MGRVKSSEVSGKSAWFTPRDGQFQLVNRRCRLRSVLFRRAVQGGADGVPVILHDGIGVTNAKFRIFGRLSNTTGASLRLKTVHLDLGGDGILFTEGIWYNGTSGDEHADSFTVFYS